MSSGSGAIAIMVGAVVFLLLIFVGIPLLAGWFFDSWLVAGFVAFALLGLVFGKMRVGDDLHRVGRALGMGRVMPFHPLRERAKGDGLTAIKEGRRVVFAHRRSPKGAAWTRLEADAAHAPAATLWLVRNAVSAEDPVPDGEPFVTGDAAFDAAFAARAAEPATALRILSPEVRAALLALPEGEAGVADGVAEWRAREHTLAQPEVERALAGVLALAKAAEKEAPAITAGGAPA